MKKDGDWIAALSAKLEVTQVDIEANEVLDLVEVTEIDRISGRPTSVRFFDRVECARLRDQLTAAIAALTSERYVAVFAETSGERIWRIEDTTQPGKLLADEFRGDYAKDRATDEVERLNAATDPKRPPDSGA